MGDEVVINDKKAQEGHLLRLKSPVVAGRQALNREADPAPHVASRADRSRDYKNTEIPRRRMNHRTREDIEFVVLFLLLIVALSVAACYFGQWWIEHE
jgi:hypothetical protein